MQLRLIDRLLVICLVLDLIMVFWILTRWFPEPAFLIPGFG